MNKLALDKFPYLVNFLQTAINQNRLFHSIIFSGSNVYMQYMMALECARLLNCLEDGREDCQCQNCRWIRENKHPSVITVSKIDNKTDSSKTVISEEQINNVSNTLACASDYKRVFIFCDADIKTPSKEEREQYEEFMQSGYNPAQIAGDDKIWYPSGINEYCFSAISANAMLKTIEEPPSRVFFFFLTNDKNDLIQTIVSRSQSFFVPDAKKKSYNTDFLNRYFETYPVMKKNAVLEFSHALYDYQTQNDYTPDYVLSCVQYYLTMLLKNSLENNVLRNRIFKDIKQVEDAKLMLKSYIKEQSVYENLAFYFARVL